MIGRFSGGFGGGQGFGFDDIRRRLLGAAPFPGTPPGPVNPPIAPGMGKGFPNIQRPLPSFPRQPSQWQTNLGDVGFTPEQLPFLKRKMDFPGPERLQEIAGAQRELRGGTYGPAPLGGGGSGYGEGYPGDALRRLLMARMGGGYL